MDVTFTLTAQINDAFTSTYGYSATIPSTDDKGVVTQIPNPVTPDIFTQAQIELFIKNVVEASQYNSAVKTARDTTDANIKASPAQITTSFK